MSDSPVAIVTGSGSGIGRRTAQLLDEQGYNLVLVGRTESKLQDTAETLSRESLVHPADVADPDNAGKIVEATLEKFGRIDALVNNAGYAVLTQVKRLDAEQWRQIVDINLSSVVYMTRAVWDAMKKADAPRIVNVSSMASRDPFPGLGAYAAAKVGVNMFTLVTSREGERIGLKAVAIAPGAVETDMLRGMFDKKNLPEDQALDPEQVARLITDCITGAHEFTTGETIFISK